MSGAPDGTPRHGVTAALMVLFALGALLLSFSGVFLVFVSDSCSSPPSCHDAVIGVGTLGAILTPLACWVATFAIVIVRARARRRTWPVPVIGFAAAVAGYALFFTIAHAGAGRFAW